MGENEGKPLWEFASEKSYLYDLAKTCDVAERKGPAKKVWIDHVFRKMKVAFQRGWEAREQYQAKIDEKKSHELDIVRQKVAAILSTEANDALPEWAIHRLKNAVRPEVIKPTYLPIESDELKREFATAALRGEITLDAVHRVLRLTPCLTCRYALSCCVCIPKRE